MRKFWIPVFLILSFTKLSFGKDDPKNPGTKEVSTAMAEAWCEKLQECDQKGEMAPGECRKVLKQSFQDGFKHTAGGQKVEVTQESLQECVANIKKDTCDALKHAQTLKGCEFISLLNKS